MKKLLLITILAFLTYGCHPIIICGIVIKKDILTDHASKFTDSYCITLKYKNKKGKEVIESFFLDKRKWDAININSVQCFDMQYMQRVYVDNTLIIIKK